MTSHSSLVRYTIQNKIRSSLETLEYLKRWHLGWSKVYQINLIYNHYSLCFIHDIFLPCPLKTSSWPLILEQSKPSHSEGSCWFATKLVCLMLLIDSTYQSEWFDCFKLVAPHSNDKSHSSQKCFYLFLSFAQVEHQNVKGKLKCSPKKLCCNKLAIIDAIIFSLIVNASSEKKILLVSEKVETLHSLLIWFICNQYFWPPQ